MYQAGEMTQMLRALAALLEDPGLITIIHVAAHTHMKKFQGV